MQSSQQENVIILTITCANGVFLLRLLAVGDVVASPGREFIFNNLNKIKSEYSIDFCVVNGENICSNNGINNEFFHVLTDRGADVVTLGNHAFVNREASDCLDNNKNLIRPVNFPPETAGEGYVTQDLGYARVTVINVLGRVRMEPMDCPFRAVDKVLKNIEGKTDIIIIDFHAEITSEKIAFANYFDGRVHVVFGTHTHVQTADERILPKGTAYITDLGMTGVHDSVLGVEKQIIIDTYLSRQKRKYEKAEGKVWFNACIFDIDNNTDKIKEIKRLFIK